MRIDGHDEANELFMAALGTRLKVTKVLFVNLVIIQAYKYNEFAWESSGNTGACNLALCLSRKIGEVSSFLHLVLA